MNLRNAIAYREDIPLAIEAAIAFWQPRVSKALSAEDARQINENIAGYFSLLAAWDADRPSAEAVQLKNSKVTEISAFGLGATTGPEFKQESPNCSAANNSLAA
jgi:hypothetical protein